MPIKDKKTIAVGYNLRTEKGEYDTLEKFLDEYQERFETSKNDAIKAVLHAGVRRMKDMLSGVPEQPIATQNTDGIAATLLEQNALIEQQNKLIEQQNKQLENQSNQLEDQSNRIKGQTKLIQSLYVLLDEKLNHIGNAVVDGNEQLSQKIDSIPRGGVMMEQPQAGEVKVLTSENARKGMSADEQKVAMQAMLSDSQGDDW